MRILTKKLSGIGVSTVTITGMAILTTISYFSLNYYEHYTKRPNNIEISNLILQFRIMTKYVKHYHKNIEHNTNAIRPLSAYTNIPETLQNISPTYSNYYVWTTVDKGKIAQIYILSENGKSFTLDQQQYLTRQKTLYKLHFIHTQYGIYDPILKRYSANNDLLSFLAQRTNTIQGRIAYKIYDSKNIDPDTTLSPYSIIGNTQAKTHLDMQNYTLRNIGNIYLYNGISLKSILRDITLYLKQ